MVSLIRVSWPLESAGFRSIPKMMPKNGPELCAVRTAGVKAAQRRNQGLITHELRQRKLRLSHFNNRGQYRYIAFLCSFGKSRRRSLRRDEANISWRD